MRASRAWPFDLTLCLLGLALLGASVPQALAGGWVVAMAALLAVPVVVLVARFPMVLDGEDGGIEIGFDSTVLMFLLCTFDAQAALAIWGLGVLATQLTSGKRLAAKVFNIGVGILGGATSAAALHAVRGSHVGTPIELAAMVAAAAAYFSVDYVISAISIAIDSSTTVRSHLVQPGTWLAIACFVPFDLLSPLIGAGCAATPGGCCRC